MFRITCAIVAAVMFASATPLVFAQEPPPPEGPPIQGNPYGQPANARTTTTVNHALLAKAKSWFAALQAGKVDRAQMESGANANANDATVTNARQMIGKLGTPVSFVQQSAGTQGNITYGIYVVTFHNGDKIDFLFAIDSEGKVASLGIGTPKQ